MLMNYHEMTMDEPRNSPARRKQFLVICTVMFAVLVHSCLTSGILQSIDPIMGVFPGGNYIYKFASRDYASCMSLARQIRDDLDYKSEYAGDDLIYHVYLDDPTRMGGRRQRFMTGILVGGESEDEQQQISTLLSKNEIINENPLTDNDYEELSAVDLWKRLPYETTDLPSIDSLVLQFPFTNGFVSALIAGYRVIPTMRKLAIEKGEKGNIPIVISLCSIKDEMCTHYAPLLQGKDFLMGRPDTEEHLSKMGKESFLDWEGFKTGGRKVFPFAVKYIDMLP